MLIIVNVFGTRFLAKKMTDGVLLVSISNKEILFNWDCKPILAIFEHSKIDIKSIVDYRFDYNVHFSIIKIMLRDGSVIRIEGKTIKDDKNNDLKKMVKRLKHIKRENTIDLK
jgi:hypothetical protein